MKSLTANELRALFLRFFQEKGHQLTSKMIDVETIALPIIKTIWMVTGLHFKTSQM